MLQDQGSYLSELERHATVLEELDGRLALEYSERSAVVVAVRLLRSMVANPQASSVLLDLLGQEQAVARNEKAQRHAQVIWGRVDAIVRQAVKLTYDLGRVSQDMIDAGRLLAKCAQEASSSLPDHEVSVSALDKIEHASHAVRTATRALSGDTRSILKIDHARMGAVVSKWKTIASVETLLSCFDDLGFAWEPLSQPDVVPNLPVKILAARG